MLFILDNYDSFTYNLVQRFGEIDPAIDVRVARNDEITVEEIASLQPRGIVVSPGPCTPLQAGISMALIRDLGPTIPTLGVCLGHQSIAEVFDSSVVRASLTAKVCICLVFNSPFHCTLCNHIQTFDARIACAGCSRRLLHPWIRNVNM